MKKILSLLLCIALVLSSASTVFAIDLIIDGTKVQFTDSTGKPFIDSASRTQVPFRASLETIGCVVSYDNYEKAVSAKLGGMMVKIPIGEARLYKYLYFDGKTELKDFRVLDTKALLLNGRTYLPIRPVLEALWYNVKWDSKSQTIIANKDVLGNLIKLVKTKGTYYKDYDYYEYYQLNSTSGYIKTYLMIEYQPDSDCVWMGSRTEITNHPDYGNITSDVLIAITENSIKTRTANVSYFEKSDRDGIVNALGTVDFYSREVDNDPVIFMSYDGKESDRATHQQKAGALLPIALIQIIGFIQTEALPVEFSDLGLKAPRAN